MKKLSKNRGDLPEMTGKAWLFVAFIVGILIVFGPIALRVVGNAIGTSVNATNESFNVTNGAI